MADITPAVRRFLETQRNVILSTVRKDGSPQTSPVWYLFADDTFIISTTDATAKWHNLRRDPRAALCVDDAETGQMVVAYGPARLIDTDVWDITKRLVEKYVSEPDKVQEHLERIFGNATRTIIEVRPDKVFSRALD